MDYNVLGDERKVEQYLYIILQIRQAINFQFLAAPRLKCFENADSL